VHADAAANTAAAATAGRQDLGVTLLVEHAQVVSGDRGLAPEAA
jgi:hypothetical protein